MQLQVRGRDPNTVDGSIVIWPNLLCSCCATSRIPHRTLQSRTCFCKKRKKENFNVLTKTCLKLEWDRLAVSLRSSAFDLPFALS